MYEIEKNVPIPPAYSGKPSVYPFREMKAQDSFVVPYPDGEATDAAARTRLHKKLSHNAAKFAKSSGTGAKFTTRRTTEGVRVWRTR